MNTEITLEQAKKLVEQSLLEEYPQSEVDKMMQESTITIEDDKVINNGGTWMDIYQISYEVKLTLFA